MVASSHDWSAAIGNDFIKTLLDTLARGFDIERTEIDVAYVGNLNGIVWICTCQHRQFIRGLFSSGFLIDIKLPVSWLNTLTKTDSARIFLGPNRVPFRLLAPVSKGTPTKHASSPTTRKEKNVKM